MPLGDEFFGGDSMGELRVCYGSVQVQQLYLFRQVRGLEILGTNSITLPIFSTVECCDTFLLTVQ